MENHPALPAEHQKASKTLERLINNRLFQHGSPDHPQFLTSAVTLGVGLEEFKSGRGGDNTEQQEVLQVTIKDPHVDMVPTDVKEAVLKTLSEIPVLKNEIAFGSDEDHVKELRAQLQTFINAGANIDPKLVEWKGFDAKNAGDNWRMNDHALGIDKNELGISINIGTDRDTKAIADNIRSRIPDIKNMLAERVTKYKSAGNPTEKQAFKTAIDALDITIEFNEGVPSDGKSSAGGYINVRIESKLQKEVREKQNTPGYTKPKQEVLLASNILSSLEGGKLGKALGRSFLYAGETAKDVFPQIAGREDVRREICKKLAVFKQQCPDHAKTVDAYLQDDTFKEQSTWNKAKSEQPKLKAHPVVNKDADKPGEMKIILTVPKGKAYEAIKQIAALDPAPEQSFAKVDSMQVVAGPEAIMAQVQELIKAFGLEPKPAAKTAVAADNKKTELFEAYAKEIVASVEHAHSAITAAIKLEQPGKNIVPSTLLANIDSITGSKAQSHAHGVSA